MDIFCWLKNLNFENLAISFQILNGINNVPGKGGTLTNPQKIYKNIGEMDYKSNCCAHF